MWSLAVEEQFYLLWSLVLVVGLKWIPSRRRMAVCVLGLAGVSGVLMASQYDPAGDPSRVYYGTDTRVAAILVGAALACLWPRYPGRRDDARPLGPRALREVGGLVALVALGWCMANVGQYDRGLYRGGFLVVALLSAVLVSVAASRQTTLVATVLSWHPLVWLGKRSYGVYLWFWPVFMLTRPLIPTSHSPASRWSFSRGPSRSRWAAFSYRFVETPIRSGALGRMGRALRRRSAARSWGAAAWATAVVVVATLGAGILLRHKTPRPSQLASTAGINPASAATVVPDMAQAPTTTAAAVTTTAPAVPLPVIQARVTAIGDSVLMETKPILESQIPGLVFNGAVARQAAATLADVRALQAGGQVGEEVIMHLGTNGIVTKEQFDQFMELFRDVRRIVVVNVFVPRPWEAANNEVLAAGVARTPNAVLADWHKLGSENPAAFGKDGVHLTPEGIHLLAHLILSSL